MAKSDENLTPEDLFAAFKSDQKGAWTHVRIYNVRMGKRGGYLMDLAPDQLPDVLQVLSRTCGAGTFDLELSKRGSNVFGPQCRVEVDVDQRPPSQRDQGAGLVMAGPPGWPPPPYAHPQVFPAAAPAAPVVDAALDRRLDKLENALQMMMMNQRSGEDDMMRGLFRDMLLERNKVGTSFVDEHKRAFEAGLEAGKRMARAPAQDPDSPTAWFPFVDRVAKVLETRLAASNTSTAPSTASSSDGLDIVAFCKSSIAAKVEPRTALAQVRALLGEANVRQLVEQRTALVDTIMTSPDFASLREDPEAQRWLVGIMEALDDMAKPSAPSTTTTAAVQ